MAWTRRAVRESGGVRVSEQLCGLWVPRMWVRVTPGGCLTGAGARGLAGQAAWGAGGWPGWLARRSRAAVARRPVVLALNRVCTAQVKVHSAAALGLPRTH